MKITSIHANKYEYIITYISKKSYFHICQMFIKSNYFSSEVFWLMLLFSMILFVVVFKAGVCAKDLTLNILYLVNTNLI